MNTIDIYFEDIKPFKISKNTVKKVVNNLIINELKEEGAISIVFCSDDYLLGINKQYLNHNYYTDIITFDYVENNSISGDLFISIDRIKENSKRFSTDFNKELFRVIIHGVLHLVGYNDKSESEQKIMTEKENYYLQALELKENKL